MGLFRRVLSLPLYGAQAGFKIVSALTDVIDLLFPSPENIRLVGLRRFSEFGYVPVPGSGQATGSEERTLGTMDVSAPQRGVLVVTASVVVENSGDASGIVQLRTYVDEARIGRSFVEVSGGSDETLVVVAPLQVASGEHKVRIALMSGDTPVILADLGAAALLVPVNMATLQK